MVFLLAQFVNTLHPFYSQFFHTINEQVRDFA